MLGAEQLIGPYRRESVQPALGNFVNESLNNSQFRRMTPACSKA